MNTCNIISYIATIEVPVSKTDKLKDIRPISNYQLPFICSLTPDNTKPCGMIREHTKP